MYLACKIEEFNISITQFISNIKQKEEDLESVILNYELLVMQKLNFELTIHNFYRPFEGFLLDVKVISIFLIFVMFKYFPTFNCLK